MLRVLLICKLNPKSSRPDFLELIKPLLFRLKSRLVIVMFLAIIRAK